MKMVGRVSSLPRSVVRLLVLSRNHSGESGEHTRPRAIATTKPLRRRRRVSRPAPSPVGTSARVTTERWANRRAVCSARAPTTAREARALPGITFEISGLAGRQDARPTMRTYSTRSFFRNWPAESACEFAFPCLALIECRTSHSSQPNAAACYPDHDEVRRWSRSYRNPVRCRKSRFPERLLHPGTKVRFQNSQSRNEAGL